MKVDCKIPVNASKEAIWSVMTDFEHMVDIIQGIIKAEILERPTSDSLVGLKWTETRIMFGSEATETMWITDSVPHEYYQTRAESCGAIYISRVYISTEDQQNYLGMKFEGECASFCSKVMMIALGWMFVGESKKAMLKDLKDIKAIAETLGDGGKQQGQAAEPTEMSE
jgi:hypothetical protein